MIQPLIVMALGALLATGTAQARQWTSPVRGSWVRHGAAQQGDVMLVNGKSGCEIVVGAAEASPVHQAAIFLAGDIARISGYTPPIVTKAGGKRTAIVLRTAAHNPRVPFTAMWEAYKVNTNARGVDLVGSDSRGTAYAAYTLSERLGVDPLYLWTGYTPERHNPLVLKKTSLFVKSPTFKYRGFFHDDEDILPRPFDPRTGYPSLQGTTPDEWYERFFETELRLRMNMVAPWTRAHRNFRIQKMASDWGLMYTSHHYDILLSNPYGYDRKGLAKKRGISGPYDYVNNKAGSLAYWKAGAEENRNLDAIYPVGLRGTEDYGHKFPPEATADDKAKVYSAAIREQIALAKEVLPPHKTPVFTFTLYDEMLPNFRAGHFDVPSEAVIIWCDDWDGVMRDLPDTRGVWKHGVYYHLAYQGGRKKQTVHTVTPMRMEHEFRRIVEAGATEYVLVNVSELRDYVMGSRHLAEIAWDADAAFAQPNASDRFVNWWCREYFGAAAATDAARAYRAYYDLLPAFDSIWYGIERVSDALMQLMKKVNGEDFERLPAADVTKLKSRLLRFEQAMPVLDRAEVAMSPEQGRFFHENARLGLSMDYYPTKAALLLEQALETPDNTVSLALVRQALAPLGQLEADIRRAERPPFQDWYRATWARPADYFNVDSHANPHRPYDMVRMFLEGRP